MTNYTWIYTNKGLEKLVNCQAGGSAVEFKSLAIGDGNGAYYDIAQTQTALVHEVTRIDLLKVEKDSTNSSVLNIEAVLPSDNYGYTIREIGLIDSAGDLLAIKLYPALDKTNPANGQLTEAYFYEKLVVSNTANVTITIANVTCEEPLVDDAGVMKLSIDETLKILNGKLSVAAVLSALAPVQINNNVISLLFDSSLKISDNKLAVVADNLVQKTGSTMSGALLLAAPTSITSSSGILALTSDSNSFIANGTEAITSITGLTQGVVVIRWNTARTLTYNAASLILLGKANRTTTIGDIGIYEMTSSGARELSFFNASGLPIATVPYNKGGTGLTSVALGQLIYGSSASAFAALAGNTTTTRKFLTQTGTGSVSAAPTWGVLAASDLPISGVTAGSYYNPIVTTDIYGRITSILNGTAIQQIGTCSTASATAAKAVTLPNFSLIQGATIQVKFTNANTATVPTLNVNSTGAKAIYNEAGTAVSATNPAYFPAGSTVEFTYDGTNWVFKKRVVENYNNGSSWYRIYSDGWIEQGGLSTTSTEDQATITLLKNYKDTNYYVNLKSITTSYTEVGANNGAVLRFTGVLYSKSISNFLYWSKTNDQINGGYMWEAKGY